MFHKIKILDFSILAAISLSAVQFYIAINSSLKVLWQVYLTQHLVGPGPILGYSSDGSPMHEGTPVHMVAAYVGLCLGVLLYSIVYYRVILKLQKRESFIKAKK
jgi:hypothetical protein